MCNMTLKELARKVITIKGLEAALTLSLFALFLLLTPGKILIWAMCIPGLIVWYIGFRALSYVILNRADKKWK